MSFVLTNSFFKCNSCNILEILPCFNKVFVTEKRIDIEIEKRAIKITHLL